MNAIMMLVLLLGSGCAALEGLEITRPPSAREICAEAPKDRALWDKACAGLYQPRRAPADLCNDPDGRHLWPGAWWLTCEERR